MMKTQRLFYMTASFLVLSLSASAEEPSKCESMGYTVSLEDCKAINGTPLFCPFYTPEDPMTLCLTRSCRGYPLWKKNNNENKYYHLTADGKGVIEAKPSSGNLSDYVKSFESCITGSTDDKTEYFRVKECKEGMLYINDICDVGCTASKYPYDKHPGDMAGTVEMCEDSKGEHYGYSRCNDGWTLDNAQCLLSSCDIQEYPYMGDPNLINNENRGTTQTCRIGGNAYYRYTSCQDGYELKRGVCVKRCALTSCSKTPITIDQCIPVRNAQGEITSYNSCTYNDWSCEIDDKCRIGDYITYNEEDIGILFHIGTGGEDKNLALGLSDNYLKWAHGEYETINIATITDITDESEAKNDYNGKINTKKICSFTSDCTTNYPAAAYCYNYNVNCDIGSICATGEWYLSGLGEVEYMYDNRYLLFNVTGRNTFTQYYGLWSSSEVSWGGWNLNAGLISIRVKYDVFKILPTLAF